MSSFMDKAKDIAEDVAHKAGDLVDKAGEHIPDSVKETAGNFGDKAGELVEKVKEKLHIGSGDAPATPDTPAATSTEPASPRPATEPTPEAPASS
jgi:hypothetical protein